MQRGAHARLEPDGLLWNPARNCLVGATTPLATCMAILKARTGLTDAECRRIMHGRMEQSVPVKAGVRKAEGLAEGDEVELALDL